jgi:ATP-dependent protease ClpP protease subunit
MPRRIDVKGVIVANDDQWIYDWFGIESTSPAQVMQAIEEANGDDLEVYINSPGGDVYTGSEIYTALKEYRGNVTVKITGIAASAASIIAMAGKKVMISPTAQIMIHNVSSVSIGDYRAHAHESDVLKNWNKSIANAYRLKSGLSESELLKLMNQETWLTAQEALDKGFVDEIMFDEEGTLRLAASAQVLPRQVIDKIRNELLKKKGEVNHVNGNQLNQTPAAQAPAAQTVQNVVSAPQAVAGASQPAAGTPAVDPVVQERERLRAIDEIAANIDPELVKEAKYGPNPMTAEQLTFRAMKEGKIINSGLFDQAVAANKAAGTDGVQAGALPQNSEKEYDLNNLKDVNAIFAAFAATSQAHRPQNIRRG